MIRGECYKQKDKQSDVHSNFLSFKELSSLQDSLEIFLF